MQAQLDDRYKTLEEAEQAAASPMTGTTANNSALQHPPMASSTQDLTKLEADVVLLNKQLLDLGDKWNFFAAKYSEAKDQLLAAKLHSENMSKLLQDATTRLHEAELDKTLTQFHLQLSESATAYYKRTCEELKQKLEDVVKTIKATQLAIVTPQVTTIIPISVQDKPNHNSSYNEIVSAYYIIGLTIFFFFLLFFFLLVTP
jgi:chromosome segregation ATPase